MGDVRLTDSESKSDIASINGEDIGNQRRVCDRRLAHRESKGGVASVHGVIGNNPTLAAQGEHAGLVSEGSDVVYKGNHFKNAGQRNPHVRLRHIRIGNHYL